MFRTCSHTAIPTDPVVAIAMHNLDAEGRDAHARQQSVDFAGSDRRRDPCGLQQEGCRRPRDRRNPAQPPAAAPAEAHPLPSTAPSDVDLTGIAIAEGGKTVEKVFNENEALANQQVTLDKDFGMGYQYPAILDSAEVTVEVTAE